MSHPRVEDETELNLRGSMPPDALWIGGVGAALLLVLAARILFRQGRGSPIPSGLQWLRLARALLRFLQLAAEISRESSGDEV